MLSRSAINKLGIGTRVSPSSTRDLYTKAYRIWSLLFISLPVDFILPSLGIDFSFRIDPVYAAFVLFLVAWAFTWRAGIFWALSNMRTLKNKTTSSINSNKIKSRTIFLAVMVITCLDALGRLLLGRQGVGVAALVIGAAIALFAAYRGMYEIREHIAKVEAEPWLKNQIIDLENFIVSILPAIVLRLCALCCVLSIVSSGLEFTNVLIYLAAILSFQNVIPVREDFFNTCRSCGLLHSKSTLHDRRCPSCSKGRGK